MGGSKGIITSRDTQMVLDRDIQCSKCVEFEELFDFIHGIKLRPYQKPSKAMCVFCGLSLFKVKDNGRYASHRWIVSQKSKHDNKFCLGPFKFWVFSFKRNCPTFPHIHRYCETCKGSWIEQTKEQSAVSSH